jgi:hypothetical protein
MRPLSARELLDVWEQGRAQDPAQRALSLLSSRGEGVAADLEHLPVGRRDALLMELRKVTFGATLECTTACPECRERLEVTVVIDDLRQPAAEGAPTTGRAEFGGRSIEFRLPDSADLVAVSSAPDVAEARRRLLARCVRGGATDLPEEAAAAVADEMARLDPQADIEVSLQCPACSHRWNAAVDIALQLWTEVEGWAHRLLRDVHTLASAYGWSESEVLALSAWRREAYVAMASS